MTQIVNRQLEPYNCSSTCQTCLRQAGVNASHCIRHAHCPPRVNRPLKLHKRCTCCLCVKVGMLAGPLFIGCPYFRNYICHNSDYLEAATVCMYGVLRGVTGGPPTYSLLLRVWISTDGAFHSIYVERKRNMYKS